MQDIFNKLIKIFPNIDYNKFYVIPLSGLTGGSYLVKLDKNKMFVLRYYKKNNIFFGLSVKKEYKILSILNTFVYSPNVIYFKNNLLLLEWIHGISYNNKKNFSEYELCDLLSYILYRLHLYHSSGYFINLKKYFKICWNYIDFNRVTPSLLRLHKFFQKSSQPRTINVVLSNIDINLNNILISNDGILKLLDWEYSFDCDVAFSLATLFVNNKWKQDIEDYFLIKYCRYYNNVCFFSKLKRHILMWKPWVYYMLIIWYEVKWNKTKNKKYLKYSNSLRNIFDF